ncbi:MAG: hypothetical protein AAFV53_24600 [Myxococcota bacterium]
MRDELDTYTREFAPTDAQVNALVQDLNRARRARRKERSMRAWVWPALSVVAVAAAALLFILPGADSSSVRLRDLGGSATAPEQLGAVDLRIVVDRSGVIQRLEPGQPARLGDRIFFRVSASGERPVTVLVDGPEGRQTLSTFQMDGASFRDVPLGDDLLVWRFDRRGQYRFTASIDDAGRCAPGRCDQQVIDVR